MYFQYNLTYTCMCTVLLWNKKSTFLFHSSKNMKKNIKASIYFLEVLDTTYINKEKFCVDLYVKHLPAS